MRKSTYTSYSTSKPKPWLKWAGAIFVFGAFFGLIIFATSEKSELVSENDLDVVYAPDAPLKVRASHHGGMEVANADKQVFNLLETGEKAPVDEENLCDSEKGAMLCNKELPKVAALSVNNKNVEEVASENQPKSADIAMLIGDYEEKPLVQNLNAKASETQKEEVKKEAKVEVSAPVQPQAAPSSETKPVSEEIEKVAKEQVFTGGAWGVQLASYKDLQTADAGSKIFLGKFPELLKDLTYVTEKVEIEGKGTFYRVQFVGLKSRADAQKTCALLKEKGQGCWHVSR